LSLLGSRLRVLGALIAFACACSSTVQDLGGTPHDRALDAQAPMQTEILGLGGTADIPDVGAARELVCPVSRPIERSRCALQNDAPCTYVGAPAASPDTPPLEIVEQEEITTFCVCTAELRWSCLQGVTLRTLAGKLRNDDPCEDGLTVEQCIDPDCVGGRETCRCVAVAGQRVMRCTR
jgi:hypothetical protein